MPIDTAVVGAGSISELHLSGIVKNPRTHLVGICDVDEQQARDAASRYDISSYFDVDSLLADQSLDWLHICTPVQSHFEISKKAIEAGVPLLIEKPVTETVEDLETLERLADENDVPISPVHQHLFRPAVMTAREMIQSGELGRIRAVDLVFAGNTPPDEVNRGSWVFELLGGEFEEGLPHPIYLTLGIGGFPRNRSDIAVQTSLAGDYSREFEYDGVQAQYVTSDEVLCSMKMIGGGRPKRQILVHGEEKTLAIDLNLQMVQVIDSNFTRSPLTKTKQALQYAGSRITGIAQNARLVLETQVTDKWKTEKKGTSHYEQFDRTAKALESGSDMPVPISSSRWTIQTMDEIRKVAEDQTEDRSMQHPDPV